MCQDLFYFWGSDVRGLNGYIIEGKLPKAKQKLVDAWIEIHRDELVADWELAINGEPIFKIDPLK